MGKVLIVIVSIVANAAWYGGIAAAIYFLGGAAYDRVVSDANCILNEVCTDDTEAK